MNVLHVAPLNAQKPCATAVSGIEFLGYRFEGYGGAIRVSPNNIANFKDRNRELTHRTRSVSMQQRLTEMTRYLQGWLGHFRIVPIVSFFRDLDKWIRRRLRACYWKQWTNKHTRIANLRKLGIREDEAVTHGCSSKGSRVMSSSRAVHGALSKDYLNRQGFTSLEKIWEKLAAKLRTARI